MHSPASMSPEQASSAYIVAGVMRPAATTVETEGHLAAAAYLMSHADHSALVVVDDAHRPIALVTESDILRAVAHGVDTEQERISAWMMREPPTVNPDTAVMEALQTMVTSGRRHLPVVSDDRLVGIVAISDLMHAVVHNFRLAAAVVFVADLSQSVSFYRSLLRYPVIVSDSSAALLTGPNGSQLYLRQCGNRLVPRDEAGVQWVAWTAGDMDDLERCSVVLKEHGTYMGRDTSEGVTSVEGRDPDGLPVVVVYPGAERAPRHIIHDRIRRGMF